MIYSIMGVLLAVNMIPLPSPEDIEVVVVKVLSSKPFRMCCVQFSQQWARLPTLSTLIYVYFATRGWANCFNGRL